MSKKGIGAIVITLVVIIVSVISVIGIRSLQGNSDKPAIDQPIGEQKKNENVSEKENETTVNTSIYFLEDVEFGNLVKKSVTYKVSKEEDKYIEAVKLVIAGPKDSSMRPAVNSNIKINKIECNGNLCVADFTESFITYNVGGSIDRQMCIYSIVNTLCEFDEISKVKFTVNGKPIESFGDYDMSMIFEADDTIVN